MSNNSQRGGYRFYPAVRRGWRPNSAFTPESTQITDAGELGVRFDVTGENPGGESRPVPSEVKIEMFGPGDVVGLDSRQVIRVEPEQNASDFPPNYFPLVEFDSPDLPWLFSPQSADGQGRNRPWLSLVAVDRDRDDVQFKPAGTGPLPTLEAPAEELPDPKQSWAWAHAQRLETPTESVASANESAEFAENSVRTLSRLLCPRNLEENTRYLICVVPTFEPGRRAGLGLAPYETEPGDTDGPRVTRLAWAPDSGIVRTPVYFHWECGTGPTGDFESLARELEPVELGPDIGYRTVDTSDPGPNELEYTADEEGATVALEGALQSTGSFEHPPGTGTGGSASPPDVHPADAFDGYGDDAREMLRTLLNRPSSLGDTGIRTVGPPLYGQWPTLRRSIAPAGEADDVPWFRDLNVNPQNRVAAGLGAEIVREKQEALMAAAWEQFGHLREVNDFMRRAHLASESLQPIWEQIKTASPGHTGDLIQFTAPIHDRVVAPGGLTLREAIDRSGLPSGATSLSFRRLTREGGPLASRPSVEFDPGTILDRLQEGTIELAGPDVLLDYGPTFEGDVDEILTSPVDTGADSRTPEWLVGPDGSRMAVDEAIDFYAERPEAPTTYRTAATAMETVRSLEETGTAALADLGELRTAVFDGAVPPVDQVAALEEYTAAIDAELSTLRQTLPEAVTGDHPAVSDRVTPGDVTERIDALTTARVVFAEKVAAAREIVAADEPDRTRLSYALGDAEGSLSRLLRTAERLEGDFAVEGTELVERPALGDEAEDHQEELETEDYRKTVVDALDPRASFVSFVASRLPAGFDVAELKKRPVPLAPFSVVPTFADPMYRDLAESRQSYILPGVADVPKNSVGALKSNRRFVESFLTGLNHEMARELQWRGFPTDRRGTPFRMFWERKGNPTADTSSGIGPVSDVKPMHEWTGELGRNAPSDGRPDENEDKLVLLIRGELLRRYPNTRIYAAKAQPGEKGREPTPLNEAAGAEVDSSRIKFPDFEGQLDPDITFFKFDLTADAARNQGDGDAAGWFFVLQEPPAEIRFGLDEPPRRDDSAADHSTVPPGVRREVPSGSEVHTVVRDERNQPTPSQPLPELPREHGWSALRWNHLGEGGAAEGEHVDVNSSRPAAEKWQVIENEPWYRELDSSGTDKEKSPRTNTAEEAAKWGENSAHMARIMWQQPVQVAIHADDLVADSATNTDNS